MPIVLASASPRRLALLRQIGVEPQVRPADVDETPHPGESPLAMVLRLARAKADVVAGTCPANLVVAADTVVVAGSHALGKPADAAEAAAMLQLLSGRAHQVVTGVAVVRGADTAADAAVTRVVFRTLADREIAWYVGSRRFEGKAGGYGIQDAAEVFVERIEGSYSNVVGLPLALTVTLARRLGADLLADPPGS